MKCNEFKEKYTVLRISSRGQPTRVDPPT